MWLGLGTSGGLFLSTVKNFQVAQNRGNFLTSRRAASCGIWTALYSVSVLDSCSSFRITAGPRKPIFLPPNPNQPDSMAHHTSAALSFRLTTSCVDVLHTVVLNTVIKLAHCVINEQAVNVYKRVAV